MKEGIIKKETNNEAEMKENNAEKMELPVVVSQTIERLEKSGFEAYAVGGCVRDAIRGVEPNDWDITTNARPEKIMEVFKGRSFLKMSKEKINLGTVCVLSDSEVPNLKELEITTYRRDGQYSDSRRPDSVEFTTSLEEDLKRRDFTVNAMAFDGKKIIDMFEGQKDLEKKIIRAVGDPKKRFEEDALRLMRAVRFATTLDFEIEEKTKESLIEMADSIDKISGERIRDEFLKIIKSKRANQGILYMKETGLLKKVLPELLEGEGLDQNKHHVYTVFEHNLRALDYAAESDFNEDVRLAALFHDIGKSRTKRGEGMDSTFHSHEIESTNMAYKILKRLKFPNEKIVRITRLIRYHMFKYDYDPKNPKDETTDSAVKRIIAGVGFENIEDLISLRMADRIGSGVAKAHPFRLNRFRYKISKVIKEPISVDQLEINGNDIMRVLKIGEGKRIGYFKYILFDEVLDKPELNKKDYQLEKIKELNGFSDEELKIKADKAKDKIYNVEMEMDDELQKEHNAKPNIRGI